VLGVVASLLGLGLGFLPVVASAAVSLETTSTTAVAAAARISLTSRPGGMRVDQTIELRGRVRGTGRANNKTILLERRHSKAWRTTERLRRQDDGRYRFRLRAARAGFPSLPNYRQAPRRPAGHLASAHRPTGRVPVTTAATAA